MDENGSELGRPMDAGRIRTILDEYEGPLLRYAARITGDVERARDVVQETFLKLCQRPTARRGSSQAPRRGSPQGQSDHVAQWLFTVCRNGALDVSRKERRMKPLSEQDERSRPGEADSPPEAAERAEAAGHVTAALADLPANQQEVLRLKFQDDFSYKQIAGITGLSVSNVGFLIHTGIKKLRNQFQALGLLGS